MSDVQQVGTEAVDPREPDRLLPVSRVNDGRVHVDQSAYRSINADTDFALVKVEVWPVEPEKSQELLALLGETARKWLDANMETDEEGWSRKEVNLDA